MQQCMFDYICILDADSFCKESPEHRASHGPRSSEFLVGAELAEDSEESAGTPEHEEEAAFCDNGPYILHKFKGA